MATTVGDGGPAHVPSDPRRSDCMFRHGITSPIGVDSPGQTNYIPSNSGQIGGFNWDRIENIMSNLLDDQLARMQLPDYYRPNFGYNQFPYLPPWGGFGMQTPMAFYQMGYPNGAYFMPNNNAQMGYPNGAYFIPNNNAPQIREHELENSYLQSSIIVKKDRPNLLGQSHCNKDKEDFHCKYWDKTDKILQEMRSSFNDSAEELKHVVQDAIYVAFHPDEVSDSSDIDSDTPENLPVILATPNDDEEKLVDDQSMVIFETEASPMPDDLNVEECSTKSSLTDTVPAEVGYIDMAYNWEKPYTEEYTETDADSFYSELSPLASDVFYAEDVRFLSTAGLRRWAALRRIGN